MAAKGERITLADGGTVLVRDLVPADREGYAEAVGAMSDRSRYLRFASPKPRLSSRELDYLTRVDGEHHVAIVAIHEGDGVAVARYVRYSTEVAEVAIGVADAWQRRGLARLMLGRLIDRARAAPGLLELEGVTLGDNVAAQGLLRSSGFTLDHRDGILLVYRRAV